MWGTRGRKRCAKGGGGRGICDKTVRLRGRSFLRCVRQSEKSGETLQIDARIGEGANQGQGGMLSVSRLSEKICRRMRTKGRGEEKANTGILAAKVHMAK